jgi:hypothetical protein
MLSPRDALDISRVLVRSHEAHTSVLFLLKIHMTGNATHAVRRIYWSLQRAVRSGTEQATCDARHETAAGAASCIYLSRPVTQQTILDPPNLPYPTRRCEERERKVAHRIVCARLHAPTGGALIPRSP